MNPIYVYSKGALNP